MLNRFQIECRSQGESHFSTIENRFKHAIERLEKSDTGVSKWKLQLTAERDFSGVIQVNLPLPQSEKDRPRFFMPAFLYGSNRAEEPLCEKTKVWPRLHPEKQELPFSSFWRVRSDRLSHPFSAAYVNSTLWAISVAPLLVRTADETIKGGYQLHKECDSLLQFNGFGCDISGQGTISFTLGYENAPALYIHNKSYDTSIENTEGLLDLSNGERVEIVFYSYELPGALSNGMRDLLDANYNLYHEAPLSTTTPAQAHQDIAQAIFEDSYVEDAKNYSVWVYDKGDHLSKSTRCANAWTGGIQVATPLLEASYLLDAQPMRAQALECIENLVDHGINPKSGLYFEASDQNGFTSEGWWSGNFSQVSHCSYVVGQIAHHMVKSYMIEKTYADKTHTNWLQSARGVINVMLSTRNGDHEVAYLWSDTGKPLEYNSFGGVWAIAAGLLYDLVQNEQTYLHTCRQSLEHYYHNYVKRFECYATPLDTFKAVDSEGILAFIKACHYLHQLTGEELVLDWLRDALYYEFSFKFCWNPPIQVPPLSHLKWSACGGSVTSVCNPHIHPMSHSIIEEMQYYLKQRTDTSILSRLNDTITWGTQSYNRKDNEFDFGRKGWMSERFCHSQGLLEDTYPDGTFTSTWFCFLPWGAANVVEGYNALLK